MFAGAKTHLQPDLLNNVRKLFEGSCGRLVGQLT
jgi:hypothetical protein